MKKLVLLLAFILPSMWMMAQGPQAFCPQSRVKIDNIIVTGGTVEFDVSIKSDIPPADLCGVLYLGNADAIIGFDSTKFNAPTVNKVGGAAPSGNPHCLFEPTDPGTDFGPPFGFFNTFTVRNNAFNNTATELLPQGGPFEAIAVNLNGPTPGDQGAFTSLVPKIEDNYTVGKWCRIAITGYVGDGTDHGLVLINPQTGVFMPGAPFSGEEQLDVANQTKIFSFQDDGAFLASASNVGFDDVLPVRLIDFAANKYNRSSSMLIWQTVTEQNASHFMIERSERGTEAWESVGKVDAAGNSTSVETYEFIDRGAYDGLRARVEFLYRLKIVDNDDSFEYSNIEAVTFTSANSGSGEVTVFPNPVKDVLHVQIADNIEARPSDIVIYDVLGKRVYSKQIADDADYTYINMYEAGMEAGTYLVQFMNSDMMISQEQVIVQR